MYAVIRTGGKQYKVSEGDVLRVEKLAAAEGETVQFDEVLLVADGENVQVGTPTVAGVAVTADVVRHGRGPKIRIVKLRRRKHHRKQMGHRQWFTELRITAISAAAGDAAKAASAKAKAEPAPTGDEPTDDLTQINGLGPKAAEKLAAAGIRTFRQLAALSPEEAARLDAELKLGGRIERDDWVGQAKAKLQAS